MNEICILLQMEFTCFARYLCCFKTIRKEKTLRAEISFCPWTQNLGLGIFYSNKIIDWSYLLTSAN